MKPILLSLLVASLSACATDDGAVTYPAGLGTPESPVPSDGSYVVTSRIDLALAATKIDAAVANLRAFAAHPAHLLLTEAAASPELLQLNSALSTTLRAGLESYLDTEIDKVRISGKTLRQYTTDVADISAAVFDQFTIESSLEITPTGAVHSFTDLNFTPLDLDIIVPIGGLAADQLTQHMTAVVGEGGALALGDQRFGLAFGDHAWQGINLASTTLYGADLSALTTGLDCRAIAQIVAARCVSGVCVGHTSQLQAVCESGRTKLLGDLRDQVTTIDLDVLHLAHGKAHLVDSDGDGIANKIVDGTWDVQAELGAELHQASATFVAWE